MSSSSSFADYEKFSGHKHEKLPEKSMFSQTCSLLREYLKEKGQLGDLNLGMSLTPDGNATHEAFRPASIAATNLFPAAERLLVAPAWNVATPPNLKSMNLFPQQAGFGTSVCNEDVSKVAADHCVNKHGTTEPEKAQMTIFYGGQVIVFDDFPADKAKEVMNLASMGSSKNPPSTFPSNSVRKPTDTTSLIPSSTILPIIANKLPQELPKNTPRPIDLPIARKASLTRFLEKRKDRINARAPYNLTDAASALSKHGDSKSWLGLAAQSSNAV